MSGQSEDITRRPAKRLRPISEADEEADNDEIRGNQASSTKANELSPVEKELSQFFTENNIDIASCLKVFSSQSDTAIQLLKMENSSLREKLKKSRESHNQDKEDLEKIGGNYQINKKTLEDTQARLIETNNRFMKTREADAAILKENQVLKDSFEVLVKERDTVLEAWNSGLETMKEEFTNGPQREIRELLEEISSMNGVIKELESGWVVTEAGRGEGETPSEAGTLLGEAEKEARIMKHRCLFLKGEGHRLSEALNSLQKAQTLAEKLQIIIMQASGNKWQQLQHFMDRRANILFDMNQIGNERVKAKIAKSITEFVIYNNQEKTTSTLTAIIVGLKEEKEDLITKVQRMEEKLKTSKDKLEGYLKLGLGVCDQRNE